MDGPCPECGQPIADTFGGKLLRRLDLAVLRRIDETALLQLAGPAVVLSFFCFGRFSSLLLALWALGLWKAAPSMQEVASRPGLATCLRSVSILMFATPIALIVAHAAGINDTPVRFAAVVIAAGGAFATLTWTAQMAEHVPSRSLRRAAGWHLAGLIVPLAAGLCYEAAVTGVKVPPQVMALLPALSGIWTVGWTTLLVAVLREVQGERGYVEALAEQSLLLTKDSPVDSGSHAHR